jgi:hypothetical protein
MDAIKLWASDRSTVRRAVRARCQAVAENGFRLIGEKALDLSTDGLLLACDAGVVVGETMLLSIEMPTTREWIDAEAVVARVVEGYRVGDRGYCAGLRFTAIDFESWRALRHGMRGSPPPVPMRSLRSFFALTNAPAFAL